MSTPHADCAECRALIGGYVLEALDPDEMTAVRRHLAICPQCAAEHAQLADIPALLALAGAEETPYEAPPAALEEAVLDRFAREHRAAARRERPPRRRLAALLRTLRRPLPAALAGGLAAATIALGIVLLTGDAHHYESGNLYQAHLTGSPVVPAARAVARLQTVSSGTQVWLRVRGLRGSPDDLYELWCLRDDGSKISAGTFRVNARGQANVNLTTAAVVGEYHRLSVERKPSPPASARGERVMAGEIEYGSS